MRTTLQLLLFVFLLNPAYANNKDSVLQDTPLVLETNTGKLYGSLCMPGSFQKGMVVILIAGSGPTDRNGNSSLTKNNNLKQIAYSFADAGIASLRFDKRGIGESQSAMKKEEDLRFDDYISDVEEWIKLLKKKKCFNKIVVAGHSEGSLIGMVAAAKSADIFISISGAGEPIYQTLKKQLSKQPDTIRNKSNIIIDSLMQGHMVKDVPLLLYSIFRPSVQPYMINWFQHNPQTEIKKLKMPVLIINGDKDLQVDVENAEMLQRASPKVQLVVLKDMNHVLKTVSDEKDNYKSYKDPERPLHPELMKVMIEFIKTNS
jgi:pimeloyl-ACP methyl ester carboxylesterase